ncbi:MAG: xthA [Gammaproteobacteria bacterium]|jgi:exodeoxyribonuclease-3|nr:xthA [Gammaproteobacteria bacterium]
MSVKIATWNVNSLKVRLPQVLQWLEREKPNVLALQETKTPDVDFPLQAIHQAGYQVVYSGQRTYNGMAILSLNTCSDVVADFPNWADPQRRILGVTLGDLRIFNLYVPNGENVTSQKYLYKLAWLHQLQQLLAQELKTHSKLIVLGDFNIAPHDQDVYDPLACAGQILCSDKERKAFEEICQLGLRDCFRLHPQPDKSFSWWDYRMNSFKRNRGLRIDHILSTPVLSAYCQRCYIDKLPRSSERPSDHAPVVAEFSA